MSLAALCELKPVPILSGYLYSASPSSEDARVDAPDEEADA